MKGVAMRTKREKIMILLIKVKFNVRETCIPKETKKMVAKKSFNDFILLTISAL